MTKRERATPSKSRWKIISMRRKEEKEGSRNSRSSHVTSPHNRGAFHRTEWPRDCSHSPSFFHSFFPPSFPLPSFSDDDFFLPFLLLFLSSSFSSSLPRLDPPPFPLPSKPKTALAPSLGAVSKYTTGGRPDGDAESTRDECNGALFLSVTRLDLPSLPSFVLSLMGAIHDTRRSLARWVATTGDWGAREN